MAKGFKVSPECVALAEEMVKDAKKGPTYVNDVIEELKGLKRGMREQGKAPYHKDKLLKRVEEDARVARAKAAQKKRNIALSMETLARMEEFVDEAIKGGMKPGEAISGYIFGTQGIYKGARASMIGRRDAIQRLGNLTEKNVLLKTNDSFRERWDDLDTRKELNDNFAREMAALESGQPSPTKDIDAQIMAQEYYKLKRQLMDEYRAAGGEIGELPDHIARQTHSKEKVRKMGEEEWTKLLGDTADWYRIFGDRNPTAKEKADFSKKVYENITGTGTKELVPMLTGLTGRAVKSRVIHYKNVDARIKYMEAAGEGNFLDAIRNDVRFLANEIARKEFLGPRDEIGIEMLRNTLRKRLKGASVSDIEKAEHGSMFKTLEQVQRFLNGEFNSVTKQSTRDIAMFYRNTQTISKLGGATANAFFGDPATVLINATNNGTGIETAARFLTEAFSSMDKHDAAGWLDGFSAQADTMIRAMGETIPNQEAGINKITSKFMNATYLPQLTARYQNSARRAFQRKISELVGDKVEFDKLKPNMQNTLNRAGITKEMWSAVGDALERGGDNAAFVDHTFFGRISDAKLEKVAKNRLSRARKDMEKSNALQKKKWDDAKWERRKRTILEKQRTDIGRLWDGMILDEMNHSVLMPSDRVQDLARFGKKKGTFEGELAATATQFLSFPMEYADKVLGRTWRQGGAPAMLKVLTAAAVSGIAIMAAKDVLNLKDPRARWTKKKFHENLLMAMDKGGAFGILGNSIISAGGPFGGASPDDALGPGLKIPFEAYNIMGSYANGNNAKATRDLIQFTKSNTPFANYWAINWFTQGILVQHLKDMTK